MMVSYAMEPQMSVDMGTPKKWKADYSKGRLERSCQSPHQSRKGRTQRKNHGRNGMIEQTGVRPPRSFWRRPESILIRKHYDMDSGSPRAARGPE
jgi:hypothetical protein